MKTKILIFISYIILVIFLIFTKGPWNFILFPLLLFILGFALSHILLESEDLLTTLLLSFTFGYSLYVLSVSIFITTLSIKFKAANYTFLLLSVPIILLSIIFTDLKKSLKKEISVQKEKIKVFLFISLLFLLFLYFLLGKNAILDPYIHYPHAYNIINDGNVFTVPLFGEPIFYHFYSDILLSGYSFFSSKEVWESAIIFAIIQFFPTIILLYKFYKKFTPHFGSAFFIFLVAIFLASSRWIHSILHFIKINDINGIIEIFKYGKYVHSPVTPKYSIFYFSFHSPTFVGLPSLLLIFFILFNKNNNTLYRGIIIGITLGFLSFGNLAFFPIITLPLFVLFLMKKEYRKILFYSFLTALILLIFNDYIFNSIKLSSAFPRIKFRLFGHTLVHSPSLVFFEYFFVTLMLFVGIYFYIKEKKFYEIDIFLLILSSLSVFIVHLFTYGDTPFLMRYVQLISLFGSPFIYFALKKIFELKNKKISILLFTFISLFIFFGFLLEINYSIYRIKREGKFSLTLCEKKAINFVREKFDKLREKIKIFERDSLPFMTYSGFFVEGSGVYNSYLRTHTPHKDTLFHKRFLDSLNLDEFKEKGFYLIVVTDDFIKKASQFTLNLIRNENLFEKIFECDDISIYKLKEN